MNTRSNYNKRKKSKAKRPNYRERQIAARRNTSISSPVVQNIISTSDEFIYLLTTIALNAWRAKKRLSAIDDEPLKEEAKRTLRHVEAIFEALEQAGCKVTDYQKGNRYDIGMPLKVIAAEQMPGIKMDMIADTIKPVIEYKGKLLQFGEVIVGTPTIR